MVTVPVSRPRIDTRPSFICSPKNPKPTAIPIPRSTQNNPSNPHKSILHLDPDPSIALSHPESISCHNIRHKSQPSVHDLQGVRQPRSTKDRHTFQPRRLVNSISDLDCAGRLCATKPRDSRTRQDSARSLIISRIVKPTPVIVREGKRVSTAYARPVRSVSLRAKLPNPHEHTPDCCATDGLGPFPPRNSSKSRVPEA